jgi:Tfp pilus assembly protein PilZ
MPEQRMAEQREFPRYRADVTLDFGAADARIAGVTWDVSKGGMFIRTTRTPEVGRKLLVTLRFPEGRQLLIQGEVVRTFQPPALTRDGPPAGFAVSIKNGDSYQRFVESVAAQSRVSA